MNRASSGVLRLIVGFTVCAVFLTVMGMTEVAKDAFASYRDFSDMSISDFKNGDILRGTITETIGCAATIESSEKIMHVIETSKRTSGYYYVIPYFNKTGDAYPEKIIIYKTGNSNQADALEKLKYETFYWYLGDYSGTQTHVRVDNAEVVKMSDKELSACREYIGSFVETYYGSMGVNNIDSVKNSYFSAIVPYVVQYKADGADGTILMIGVVMLGILSVGILIYIASHKSHEESHTYVGAYNPNLDPNLNSPTGLKNANDDPFYDTRPNPNRPRPVNNGVYKEVAPVTKSMQGVSPTNPTLPRQVGSFRTDYSNAQRPMPPIEQKPSAHGVRNFDPFTGKPLNKSTLIDTVFSGQQYANTSMRKSSLSRPSPTVMPQPLGESMPSVDPKKLEIVDLSNGGIDQKSWENRRNNAEMPKNGSIPVINPEIHNAAAMFGTVAAATEMPSHETHTALSEPATEAVTPIHAPTRADNLSAAYQVNETDPDTRGIYRHIAGGEMNAVDPYTEKNVDVSNGGVEIEEEDNSRRDLRQGTSAAELPTDTVRADFPRTDTFSVPAGGEINTADARIGEAESVASGGNDSIPAIDTADTDFTQTGRISADTVRADFPRTDAFSSPIIPDTGDSKPAEKEQSGYNIFKSGSSYTPYTSSYSGGSSYNIFKEDKKTDNSSDSDGNMGFPTESKEFPKLDTSFPTAGESDVGGKDDFIF